MTARTKRAVRDDPGAASDRRASAGRNDLRLARPRRIDGRLGRAYKQSPDPPVPQGGGPDAGLGSSPRATIGDVYSVVHELERYRGTLEILLLLYREGPATASRIRERLRPGPEAIQHCLSYLTKARLVRPARADSFPFGKSYELTDWGRDLVETPVRAWPHVLVE